MNSLKRFALAAALCSIAWFSVEAQESPAPDSFTENRSIGILIETFSMQTIPNFDAIQLLVPLSSAIELRLNTGFENQWSKSWTTRPFQEEERLLSSIRNPTDAVAHISSSAVWQVEISGQVSIQAGVSGAAWFVVQQCDRIDEAIARMSTSAGVFQTGLILGIGWSPHPRIRCGVEYHMNYSFAQQQDYINESLLGGPGRSYSYSGNAFDIPVAVHLAYKPF